MSAAALETLTEPSARVTVGPNCISQDGQWARQRSRGRGMASTDDDFSRELTGLLPDLQRSARRLYPNPMDAEDLVQATMARAWERREQFKPDGNLGGWLYRIMVRIRLDKLRRHLPGVQVPLTDDLPDNHMDDDDEVSALLATSPETALAAVAELPPELRTPLELFVVHRKRYHQISEQLNIPINTVGTRIRRARQRLQVLFTGATTARGRRGQP